MLVLGAKEAEAGNLSVRDRKGETTQWETAAFVEKIDPGESASAACDPPAIGSESLKKPRRVCPAGLFYAASGYFSRLSFSK